MRKIASIPLHFLIAICSLLVLIFFSKFQHFDFYGYIEYYNIISKSSNVLESLYASRFEPGFVIISHYISRIIPSPEAHFFLVSSVVVLLKYRLFIKNLYSGFKRFIINKM